MKHYAIFSLIALSLIMPYYLSPYFVQHRYIKDVQLINLPTAHSVKQFSESDIALNAIFKEKTVQTKTGLAVNRPPKIEKRIIKKPVPILVDMIYLDGRTRICKINGNMLREGQSYKGISVLKIEKNRVLIKTKKHKRWLILNVGANKKS